MQAAKNIMSSQLNMIHVSAADRNKTSGLCFSLHLIYSPSGFRWVAAELARQSGHDGPLWPARVHVHVRENEDIFFNAESEWKNGGGGRATISSLWLRFPDHIFRQRNTAGLLTSISVGDMYIETTAGILPTMETKV